MMPVAVARSLCTSGFLDDVTFAKLRIAAMNRRRKGRIVKVTHQEAELGRAESGVYDCLVCDVSMTAL